MTTLRNNNSYETLIYNFTKEVLVICPNCKRKAFVKSDKFYEENVKLICINCGLNKNSQMQFSGYTSNLNSQIQNTIIIGGGIDPYFHLPLWLVENVRENIFWAYNYDHLNFLKFFVSAKLRERNIKNISNKSLASRLPKWITAHKNREQILKTIEKLESK